MSVAFVLAGVLATDAFNSALNTVVTGNDTLRSLNARVDVEGEAPDAVARSFLDDNGFTG